MLGLCAASSGVLPPSSSHGQSAMPSPWMMTYFISVSMSLENLIYIRLDHDGVAEVFHRGVGILEAMAGERADHDRAGLDTAGRAVLDEPRHRRRRGRLGENSRRGNQSIGGEDFRIGDHVNDAAGFVARGNRLLPAGRIANFDRGRNRIGIIDRMADNDRRRLSRLIAHHLGKAAATDPLPCTRDSRPNRR